MVMSALVAAPDAPVKSDERLCDASNSAAQPTNASHVGMTQSFPVY
jgi:hypothetical protein